jgi:hypothetical protein
MNNLITFFSIKINKIHPKFYYFHHNFQQPKNNCNSFNPKYYFILLDFDPKFDFF